MFRYFYTILLCIGFIVSRRCAYAKILQGQLVTNKNWAFLTRFCFLSEKGRFQYDFVIDGSSEQESSLNLLLYYDAPNQWPSIYPSNRSCEERLSILNPANGQIVPLRMLIGINTGCVKTFDGMLHCKSYREFKSSRPRWWFIALADCTSKNGLNVTYSMSLTNASPGSFWREHFSADEFYILPELIGAVCVYVILLGWSIYTAFQLRLRRLLHSSYKIFITSIACQLMGISCEVYGMSKRAITGVDEPSFSLSGNFLEAYSETLYALLLLLMALGYTVTKSQLTSRQILYLSLFVATSFIFQMSLFIYQAEVFDPGLVLYIYESPPGYALIGLKLFTWLAFISCCYGTSRVSTTKSHFYASLLTLGSAWFLCHPITVLAITILVEKWIRESVVKGCSLWMIMVGHALFLYVTRPSSTNERFPFHIRTCQVVPAGVGQNHSYEPRRPNVVSLFTVSHFMQNRAPPGL